MLQNEFQNAVGKISETQQAVTSQFFTQSLETMNQVNPMLFSEEVIERWQNFFEKNTTCFNENVMFANNMLRLFNYTTMRSFGLVPDPVVLPEKGDRRFFDESWNEHAVFDHIKQFYLLISKYLMETAQCTTHLDDKVQSQYDFYVKQWLDALSPANFAATNPQVLNETINQKGQNLIQGAKSLIEDFARGKGQKLMTRMTDYESFEVGENVATTPGKMIYQNDLIQLIQYEPTTKTVFETPLLICPPWINKFYILDLRKENSFIQWAVDQGHTVFVISWVNPDETYADYGFEDYMDKGLLTAIDKVKEETGASTVNTIGYCIGGTLMEATNAYLAKKRKRPINTTTYFTTMIDFEEPGDLGVFIDEMQLKALEADMAKDGYLDGSSMATVFNMLRANDLIWPFFINNYLLGKEPTAFDLLYWNSDSTRLPAKTHSFYLRTCYLQNLLKEPGGIELNGTAIDINKIKVPTYFISTREDHITPWKSTYEGAKLMSGPVRFVLGGSGHIAGIINPPVKNKYGFWTNDAIEEDADKWLENAAYTEGSWWPDWHKWVSKQSGKKITARKPGSNLKPIEDAPGSYVKHRIVPE